MKNYYEILGLEPNATNDEIKTAFRKLSMKFHPDKNDGDNYFEQWTKKVNEAYETLGNNEKKRIYDENLNGNYSRKQNVNSHSSTSEKEILNKIKELTPEFLNAKKSFIEASIRYHSISSQSIPNKFTTTRILLIVLLFLISFVGLKNLSSGKLNFLENQNDDIANSNVWEKDFEETLPNLSISLKLSTDVYDSEPAIIKEIKTIDNDVYIVVDVVQIKYKDDFEYDIVNENPKLRTYKVRANVVILNTNCKEYTNSKYIINNKRGLVERLVLITTNNLGELTGLNIGCYN